MTGGMKNLLDHLDFFTLAVSPRKEMFSKKAFILTTATGTAAAVQQIKKCLKSWGINRVSSVGIRMFIDKWNKMPVKKQQKQEKRIRKAARSFYDLKKKRPYISSVFMYMMNKKITIRPEEHKDYKSIVSMILRSFQEETDYSDGTDIIALVEEIRDSEYYIPELSFVAELNGTIVGHFLFSRFPLSPSKESGHGDAANTEIVILAPVSVHADYFHQGIGTAMLTMGIEKVKEMGFKGITVEGNYKFYNKVGFRTSSEYNIFPTSGIPMEEPKCMMCQETYKGSLDGIKGFIVYDMYFNA